MILFALLHGTGTGLPAWPAGVAAWLAGAALWPRLDSKQRRFCLILAGFGVATLIAALVRGGAPAWSGLLTQNTALLAMLASVGFLQLISIDGGGRGTLPTGRSAQLQTLAGVHVLGAVINMSVVFIMAERMAGKAGLSRTQASVLTRGFLLGAMWSPFFAAMAVVLTYSPGASLIQVAMAGLPLALIVLVWSAWDLPRDPTVGLAGFVGYPMRLYSLWLPLVLSLVVAAGYFFLPSWSPLSIISAAALAVSLVSVEVTVGRAEAAERIVGHAGRRLPAMSGEMLLFLAAGVFATGLQALMNTIPGWTPFDAFGPFEAAVTLACMMILAGLGIHAVVSIVIASAWLLPLNPDPQLLAMVFLMAWGVGLSINPMAGVHLSLQGRFGLSAVVQTRSNYRYCLGGFVICVGWLYLVSYLRGIA